MAQNHCPAHSIAETTGLEFRKTKIVSPVVFSTSLLVLLCQLKIRAAFHFGNSGTQMLQGGMLQCYFKRHKTYATLRRIRRHFWRHRAMCVCYCLQCYCITFFSLQVALVPVQPMPIAKPLSTVVYAFRCPLKISPNFCSYTSSFNHYLLLVL